MREIVLDTETTGLSPQDGHKIVEIGCVEIINYIPTGNHFHVYLDPERDMPKEAEAVHGLSSDFLRGKPKFADIADDLEAFIGESPLVIHNAGFDLNFLDYELKALDKAPLSRLKIVDTLPLARRKHPGASNSLDALCARYGVDISRREKHGALLDAELLAAVYLELMGGRQKGLILDEAVVASENPSAAPVINVLAARAQPLAAALSEQDIIDHQSVISALGDKALWRKYSA